MTIDLVRLTTLRDRTSSSPDVVVRLIDGPVAVDHPDLANENIRPIPEEAYCQTLCSLAIVTLCPRKRMLSASDSGPMPRRGKAIPIS